ncbi:MAG: hypothetical protein IKN28_05690, partial [Firmicutes bacterium]|nr:hypothetical protein [Bacillota bacterium]
MHPRAARFQNADFTGLRGIQKYIKNTCVQENVKIWELFYPIFRGILYPSEDAMHKEFFINQLKIDEEFTDFFLVKA